MIHDRRQGERVLLLLRRHPAVLTRDLMAPLLLLILWLISFYFFAPFISSLDVDPLVVQNAPPSWLVPLLWLTWLSAGLISLLWIAYAVLDWREDWIALTNQRVIVMDKTLFLHETRRDAPLNKVQNVTANHPNALGTALDFGDIEIDTAGSGALTFKSLPRPSLFREAVFNQQATFQANQPPPDDLRKAAVRAIILGQAPPQPNNSRNPKARSRNPTSVQQEAFIWHKHWAYLVRSSLVPLCTLVGATLGRLLLGALAGPGVGDSLAGLLGWAALLISPVCAGWLVWSWEDWRNDVYKLDHERLYHIESLPIGLREQSKETLVNRVSDVMYVIPGPLANLLDFGDVVIKTPGEASELVFAGIPHPRRVQQTIMERVDSNRRAEPVPDREIEAWIRAYHEANEGRGARG
jgi:Bacterial PH domain